MTYNFTAEGGLLEVVINTESGLYKPDASSYKGASVIFANDKINLYEFGHFRQQFLFHQIGTIGGVTPTTIVNANELINNLIKIQE